MTKQEKPTNKHDDYNFLAIYPLQMNKQEKPTNNHIDYNFLAIIISIANKTNQRTIMLVIIS